MAESFANKVAVITGVSSGIGHELARQLAGQGCKVGLVARRKDKLETLAEEIRKNGGTVAIAPADVANREEIKAAIQSIAQELGPIDLLMANAGIGMPTTIEPMNVEEVEQMFRVNVFGVLYSFEAVLPEMLRRGQGHLAAVSSLASYKGLPGEQGYCATKAAINSYLDGLRIQLRKHNIAVTTICPGFVKTPMTAVNDFHMPWLLDVDDAARRIIKALARKKKVLNFPRPLFLLIWASIWAPDWMLARAMRRYEEKPPRPKAD